ncbi:MAG TPA: peptide ABC transporter substrate-binding protein [Candidatus Acidoferrales bacterium]|nr:peptide ABC transporter substrate-binding protein [Candidatus Acidoferrales bacterium]
MSKKQRLENEGRLSRRAFLGGATAALASCMLPKFSGAAVQTARTTLTVIGDSVERGFFVGRADAEPTNMVHAGLARKNGATGRMFPVLARELPSAQNGTYKVNRDGTVVTVYKLRSGLTWHDGKPLTAKDFILGWKIMNDPKVPWRGTPGSRQASSITAPDDLTLVIEWKKLHWSAAGLGMIDLIPLPTHLLQEVYAAGDYDALIKLPYWNRQFVGAGPYKLAEFGPGDQVTLEAFPNYALGRPKIDRIVYQFIPDRNAALAAVLSNQVDVSLNSALGFDQAVVAHEQWEMRGKGKVYFSPNSWVGVIPNPAHEWFRDIRVRQALLHALDREKMVQTLFAGKLQVAHFMLSPKDPAFPEAYKRAVKYEYNPEKAKRLLAEAGWKPAADGVLVNAKGERFSVDGVTEAGNKELEQVQAATIAYWKAVGVEIQIKNLPRRQMGDEKYRARPGTLQWRERNNSDEYFYTQLHSANIPKAEDRYSGQNIGGWNNPRADEIIDRLEETLLQPGARLLKAELMRLLSQDLPWLPIYYFSEHVTVRSDVKGVQPRQAAGVRNATAWNIHSWTKG